MLIILFDFLDVWEKESVSDLAICSSYIFAYANSMNISYRLDFLFTYNHCILLAVNIYT